MTKKNVLFFLLPSAAYLIKKHVRKKKTKTFSEICAKYEKKNIIFADIFQRTVKLDSYTMRFQTTESKTFKRKF